MTTRVFPNLKHDRMALKLNGKDDNLRRDDFRTLAANSGLKTADADAAIDDTLSRLALAMDQISLPKVIERSQQTERLIEEMLDICRSRVRLPRGEHEGLPLRGSPSNRRA